DGTTTTPLGLLADYRDRAQRLVDTGDHSLGDEGLARYVIDLWTRMLTAVESQDFSAVNTEIDWVMKRTLIERSMARGTEAITDPRIHRLDIAYHDSTPATGLFPKLEAAGRAKTPVLAEAAPFGTTLPPAAARATIRGQFVHADTAVRRDCTVDWLQMRRNHESRSAVDMKDPFATMPPQAEALIAGL